MDLFSASEQTSIRVAIESAENLTSGEIRVCVEETCNGFAFDRATAYFQKLNMNQTIQRNGVLIYLAIKDRKFSIIGDQGINQVVPTDFWNMVKEAMREFFKQDRIADGVIIGIQMAGEKLKTFFPRLHDDTNELSNDIVFIDSH